MNSVALRWDKMSQVSRPVKWYPRWKTLAPLGLAFALSMAYYWHFLSNPSTFRGEPLPVSMPIDRAVYEWKGFYRVAPVVHATELNRI
jgi:hypothetical protein